ncbi:MAG: hypothetical protein IH624_02220 [Phycisphaerae bacterium]|nr:hypothetical protein [Phycisphaerae bacterium]
MTKVNTSAKDPIASTRLTLKDGWRALVALRDPKGNVLSPSDWEKLLADPRWLLDGDGRRLKSDECGSVRVRTIRVGARDLCVVVKVQKQASRFKGFFRNLRSARAVRTFRTAVKLQAMGVASEYPLAALEQRKGLWSTKNIYISNYIESRNLYYFLREDLATFGHREPACRRTVARQIAEIFAGLHNGGLWHRDAKAGNFVVQVSGNLCKVMLVDLDGIKPYRLCRRRNRFRSLAKLASTVLCHRSIHSSDYRRTFSTYCEFTDLREDCRKTYRELATRAVAVRLLSMATSAMEGRGIFVDANG